MAKRTPRRKNAAANKDKFTAGAKVDGLDNVAKLAASAAAGNAAKGIGHNSGITDDEMVRQMERIDAARTDMDGQQVKLDKAKGVYRQAIGVAKEKGFPVDALKKVYKMEKQTEGSIVTEHREIRRILQLRDSAIVKQFDLFNVPGTEPVEQGGKPAKPGMDAELQGQAAYHNGEPESNNAFQPGTEDFVMWQQGWRNAAANTSPELRHQNHATTGAATDA